MKTLQIENQAQAVEQLISERKYIDIKQLFPKHPEDISVLIASLSNPAHKLLVFRLVSADKAIDVFEYLSTEEEEQILNSLSSQEIKELLNSMSPDDRTELFEEMPAELVKKFVSFLTPRERAIALEILNFPEDSVGRLLTPDFVQLYESMTVEQALIHIRNVGIQKETIYHCYVLDSEKKLIGIVSLKKLVLSPGDIKISQIMYKDVIKVEATTDKEEAANIFKRYDLFVIPVVNAGDKLLGIVTFDDLVDVLEEEATEDFEKIAAVVPVEKPYMEANFINLVIKRSPWLILLVILESASGLVIRNYEIISQKWFSLTVYLPLLIATGGNAGMQSAMMVIRGLTTGDINAKDFLKVVFREALLGISIGAVLAIVGMIRVFIQEGGHWIVSVSIGVAMGLTVMIAAMIGAALPLIFRKMKLDPA
ncbi:MAG: magnesium transporter, partial [Candidatus Omnitrophica bacterium]|nr:magnesium transporter [Candidatus Omnitrophota bacterium]